MSPAGGGRAHERTVQAWNRSGLAILATAGFAARAALEQGAQAVALVGLAVLLLIALGVLGYGVALRRRGPLLEPPTAMGLMAGATALAAATTCVVIFIP